MASRGPAARRSARGSPRMWRGVRARSARPAIRGHAGGLADVAPDRVRKLLARHVDEAVAIADGDRKALRERKQPFDEAADDAENRRRIGRRIETKMGIDDGAEF